MEGPTLADTGMPFSNLMGVEILERSKDRVRGRLTVREDGRLAPARAFRERKALSCRVLCQVQQSLSAMNRRSFLRTSLAAGAAWSAAGSGGLSSPHAASSRQVLKTGIRRFMRITPLTGRTPTLTHSARRGRPTP